MDPTHLRIFNDVYKSQQLTDSQGQVTWVVGTDPIPTTVYGEAIAGSGALGDVLLALAATDATAATRPARPSTTQATRAATAVFIHIYRINPNGGGNNRIALVGANGGTVIVGQGVQLVAQSGPAQAFPAQPRSQWTIPGSTVGGYTPMGSSATLIPTITTAAAVHFYWVDGGDPNNVNNGVARTVTYWVGGPAGGLQTTIQFSVVRPQATVTATPGDLTFDQDAAADAAKSKLFMKAI